MKYLPIDSQLFIQNRNNFVKHLKPNSIAIFNSNDEMPFNADQSHPFKQNSDIFYLSGIDQEESILLIYPDCPNPKYREALFLKKTSAYIGKDINIQRQRLQLPVALPLCIGKKNFRPYLIC